MQKWSPGQYSPRCAKNYYQTHGDRQASLFRHLYCINSKGNRAVLRGYTVDVNIHIPAWSQSPHSYNGLYCRVKETPYYQ